MQCWRAPEAVGLIGRGELKCVTPEQRVLMEQLIGEQRQRRAEEAVARRRAEEQRREAERRAAQQKLRAAQQSQEKQLLEASQQRQRTALEQQARQRDQQFQRNSAPPLDTCAVKQIEAIAKGLDPNSVQCAATAPSSTSAQPPVTGGLSKEQLDYLKRDQVRLQPDDRLVVGSAPPSQPPILAPRSIPCSTFPGSGTKKDCEPHLTPEEAAAASREQAAIQEEYEKQRAEKEAKENALREAYAARERAEQKRKEDEERKRHYTEMYPDKSDDCHKWFRSLGEQTVRNAECASLGQPGKVRCEACTITKTCTKRFGPDDCTETRTCEKVCQ